MIDYRSAEAHKQAKPVNYKVKKTPSQSLAIKMQERVLLACFLPLIRSFFLPLLL